MTHPDISWAVERFVHQVAVVLKEAPRGDQFFPIQHGTGYSN